MDGHPSGVGGRRRTDNGKGESFALALAVLKFRRTVG
jgi:hypothetical protein